MERDFQHTNELKQIVPSQTCLACDVCCRFLDSKSPFAPIFTDEEYGKALSSGLLENQFSITSDGSSRQIQLYSHQDMFVCPAFDPKTQHCTIYRDRPLDCQIYPFMLMWSADYQSVLLVVDRLCPYTENQIQDSQFKTYIDESLAKEVKHFKTKYKLEFNIISDNKLIIPEYKIDLLNKNNKIIKKVEHTEEILKNFSAS